MSSAPPKFTSKNSSLGISQVLVDDQPKQSGRSPSLPTEAFKEPSEHANCFSWAGFIVSLYFNKVAVHLFGGLTGWRWSNRSHAVTDELGPELTGWKLPLGVGGITVEQKPLVRLRKVTSAPSWVTLSCLACGTDNVFSIPLDEENTSLTDPDWEKLLVPECNNLIVHNGLKDATEIEALKQQPSYSYTFHLVMSSDFDNNSKESIQNDNPQFNRLRDELQVTYTKAIEDEEVKTHERIETYKAQQEEALSKYQQDAKDDLQRLLHMISNVLHKPTTPEPSLVPTSSSTDNLPVVEGKKSPGRHKVRFEETNESDKNTIKRQTPSNLGKAVENHKASAQHDADSEDDGDAASEEDEDMFDLDEEIEHYHESDGITTDEGGLDGMADSGLDELGSDKFSLLKSSSLPASSPLLVKARRSSQKYHTGNIWEETMHEADEEHEEEPTMYATSLPININRLGRLSKASPQANNTTAGSTDKTLRFGTYDPSLRDMATSAQFQSTLMSPTRNPLSKHAEDDEDDDSGPMIPPHLLAAQKHSDEPEELFGTAPDK
ncbi:hypothetical protein NQZ79_g6621 [Umbelopsis isabellina]|nr:hypothetical protein NQZ79_g6621 [Umbelopsis isabellina]